MTMTQITYIQGVFGALLLLLLSSLFPATASQLYLKPGQSKTLQVKDPINTIFVSDPTVADYKIINNKSVVLYARKLGVSELTVYGSNAQALLSVSVNVDPFQGDIQQRIARLYPGSQVQVKPFLNDKKSTWILTGTVPDEETRDAIYQLVGSLVGTEGTTEELIDKSESGITGNRFSRVRYYDNVINRLTLPASNQVNVKLTVVEVSKEFTDNLGIDWSSLTLDSIITGGTAVNSTGVFNLLGFKRGFDAANISTVINAIKNDTVARVLAQPNLTVLSGESANFLVGGEIPIVVRDNDGVTVQYKEYGIRLNIAAKVEKRDKIRLFVSNEISSTNGSYAFNDYQIPTLRTRRSSSTIELADGDSFAIGGLLSEEDKEALTKVPFIGDIPILGALARHSTTERSKNELVVFATVNLVKPAPVSSSNPMALPVYNRSSSESLFFGVGDDKRVREGRMSRDASSFMAQGGFAK